MLGSNFALLVKSPGDDGQQLLTTGSRYVYRWSVPQRTCNNEWYQRGIQISLHIRFPRFQACGGGYSRVNFGHPKSEVFHFRGGEWGIPE